MKPTSELKENLIFEEKKELSYLRFAPLENSDYLKHGFILGSEEGARVSSSRIPELVSIASGIPEEKFKIVIPEQVHQAQVLVFKDEIQEKVIQLEGDALLTDQANLFLVIQVADCLPVFIFDPSTRIVGLAHIGWRGAVSGIAEEVIRKSKEAFKARSTDLNLVFGPSIRKCCYKISDDLAVLFDEKYIDKRKTGNYFDLCEFSKDKFVRAGVREEKIFVSGECTFCGDKEYQSYRRDKEKAGRMIAFIGKVTGRAN
ncbi:MAG TPA: peptidoglycan editing factor PgeF [Terriglobales bacterium]|nr:peptidoglycan editing factor PgeF [Terriglobales bacterium]